MDLNDLNNTADRKRIKYEVNNLKEKVAKENEKIIKLKVQQDAAYWVVKEKLSSKERNHETLQQNMVQLQMEFESVSAKYHEELRQRPETLNKLESTREICDVLQDNLSRVRATLQRSAADRAALADAYTHAGVAVAAATADNEKRILAAINETRSARDLVKLNAEHAPQLMECVSRERSRAEQAAADAERLREQKYAIAEQLASRDTLLQERERTIQELRAELQRVVREFNERERFMAELEREAGAASALRAALAQAEARAEAAVRDVTGHVTDLALVTAAKEEATKHVATLTNQIQEGQSHFEKMKEAMNFMVTNSENLAKQLMDKDKEIHLLEKVAADSKKEVEAFAERAAIDLKEREQERSDCEERIAIAQQELIERASRIENLMADIAQTNEAKSLAEATVKEQATQLTAADSKLTKYADTIASLEQDIKKEADARARAENAVAELKTERERENCDYEKRVADATRELSACNETITQLKRDLAIETETSANAYATLVEHAAERERERSNFEERFANAERELAESNDVVVDLKRKLDIESEARAHADVTLESVRAELKSARADAASFLEDVRHLKADARRKDEEAAKQMQTILSIRNEKKRMQEEIKDLKETIETIRKMTRTETPATTAVQREPPEPDNNAVAAPSTPFGALAPPPKHAKPAFYRKKQQKAPQKPIDTTYDLFSDNSTEDAFDPGELSRRFEALSSGMTPSPVAVRKRSHVGHAHNQVQMTPAPTVPTSRPAPAPPVPAPQPAAPQPAAQSRAPDSGRRFFKTRRIDREDRHKK